MDFINHLGHQGKYAESISCNLTQKDRIRHCESDKFRRFTKLVANANSGI